MGHAEHLYELDQGILSRLGDKGCVLCANLNFDSIT